MIACVTHTEQHHRMGGDMEEGASHYVRCCVPHCRGFTRKPVDEYLCSRHWKLVSRSRKRALAIYNKIIQRFQDKEREVPDYFETVGVRRWNRAVRKQRSAWESCKQDVFNNLT